MILSKGNKYNLRGMVCRIARYQHARGNCSWREAYEYAIFRVKGAAI